MSIIDKLLSFATGQTVTGGSTTTTTDHIDLQKNSLKLGQGKPLWYIVHVKAKSAGDGSDTFVFSLVTDTDSGFATAKRTVVSSVSITGIANIAVGHRAILPIPPNFSFSRYIRGEYAVTADAVLTVDAYLTDQEPFDHTAYPDAI